MSIMPQVLTLARLEMETLLPPVIWKGQKVITVNEAQSLIFKNFSFNKTTLSNIDDLEATQIKEPLLADRCQPPFHRVAMDGIAIAYDSLKNGNVTYEIEGCQRAGIAQMTLQNSQNCMEVMTGAVLPQGTDTVIPVEHLKIANGKVTIQKNITVKPQQNIHFKGSDTEQGAELVSANSILQAPQWAIAASIGKTQLQVAKKPSIAIISTGDELVEVSQTPRDYQIRRSNVYALSSSLQQFGFAKIHRFHLKDEKENMFENLQSILHKHDVIILSGGVSMGKFDFVPQILTDLKVKKIFHKIKQKPGKPMWFGITMEQKKPVFGLPGNPVSALICLHRFVIPGIQNAMAMTPRQPFATLTAPVKFKKPLTYFLPVSIEFSDDGKILATPIKFNGSGDFSSLSSSDGFLELPFNKDVYLANESYPLRLWSNWV